MPILPQYIRLEKAIPESEREKYIKAGFEVAGSAFLPDMTRGLLMTGTQAQLDALNKSSGIAETATNISAQTENNTTSPYLFGNPNPNYKAPVAPVVTAPVVNNPAVATPAVQTGTSQIAAGQTYIQNRTALGLSSDELTTKNDYISRGLDKTYGDWRGTPEQYNAMMIMDKSAQNKTTFDTTDLRTQATDYLKSLGYGSPDEGEIRGAMEDILQQQIDAVQKRLKETQDELALKQAGGGNNLSLDELALVNVGSTDLTTIIDEISTGALTTPETELAKAQAQLLTDEQKAAAADALTTLQQNMAKRGLTFSGIRTQAEASAAATNLSKLTGISLDLSANIIKAARQEQAKRETALNQAKQLQYNALEKMGYVIDPTTGQLTKTLERERFEEPETGNAPTVIGTESTGYYQWNPDTESWDFTGIQGEEKPTAQEEKSNEIASITQKLLVSKGGDGYISPDVYQNERRKSTLSSTDFDNRFSYLLSPREKINLGIEKEGTMSQWKYDASIWQWLSTEGVNLSDEEKAQQIKISGRDPADFGLWGY